MVFSSAILGMALSALISFGMPVGIFIYLLVKKRELLKPFLIGALTFFVFQILIRIPILQLVLPKMDWYLLLQYDVWLYGLFLGFTAALFEEGGRWIFMHLFLKKYHEKKIGIVFGLGHGCIEAILLVGINSLINLLAMPASFLTMPASTFAMAGIERIIAIVFHVACSMLVWKAVKDGKMIYLGIAIIAHTCIDMIIIPLQAAGVGIGIEVIFAVFAAVTLCIALLVWRKKIF